MFLSLQTYIVVTIIAIVAVQYAIALFCLLKLAFLDITKREYVLWDLFILLVFFIGDIAFLVYYYKVKDKKRIPPYVPPAEKESGSAEAGPEGENDEAAATEPAEEAPETPDAPAEDAPDEQTVEDAPDEPDEQTVEDAVEQPAEDAPEQK